MRQRKPPAPQPGRLRSPWHKRPPTAKTSADPLLQNILSWVWIVSGLLLIVTVLLHSPKGDGMGGLASSGGSMFSSARSAEDTLNRITWTLLSLFLGLAVVLSAGWLK